jgi:hypothetical protein
MLNTLINNYLTFPSHRNISDFTQNLSGITRNISGLLLISDNSELIPERRISISVQPYGSGIL